MNNIAYSGVVLTATSRKLLLERINVVHPEVIAHHMTINMGPLKPDDQGYVGSKVELMVTSIAYDEKVQAVGVEQIGDQPKTNN